MMKSLIKTILGVITLSVISSGSTYAGEEETRSKIEMLNNHWNQAFNNSDAEQLASLYAEKALLSPGNGTTLNGRQEIENLFKGFFQAGLKNHQLQVIFAGGNEKNLFQVAKWSAEATNQDGTKVIYGGITTSVYEKNNKGQWVTLSHVWNAGN